MPPLSDCFAHSCPLSDANLKHSLIHTHYHSPPHICIFSHIHLHTYTHFPSNMHSLSHCPSPSPVFTVMLMQLTCDSGLTYTHKHSLSHSAALTKLCKPHSPVILVWHTLTFTFHLSHTVMLTQLTCDSGLTYRR